MTVLYVVVFASESKISYRLYDLFVNKEIVSFFLSHSQAHKQIRYAYEVSIHTYRAIFNLVNITCQK